MRTQQSAAEIESLLPDDAQKQLKSCPKTGGLNGGTHAWIFRVAKNLNWYSVDQDVIAALIEKHSAGCGRDVSADEIWDAINNSAQMLAQQRANPEAAHRATPRWPERNEEQIAALTKDGPSLAQLEARSPVRWTDGLPHTEEIIDLLFPGNPLLCAGRKKELAITRPREEWRGFMANQQFIVPSTMTAVFGKRKSWRNSALCLSNAYGKRSDGTDSMRCLDNTGPRRFIVVESDQGDFDQHASLLTHLAKFAPFILAVHSGNKSLHGWFFCAKEIDEKVKEFFRYAVSLGADRATWTRCQFVRMIDGKRDNGARQRVVYFNPSILNGQ